MLKRWMTISSIITERTASRLVCPVLSTLFSMQLNALRCILCQLTSVNQSIALRKQDSWSICDKQSDDMKVPPELPENATSGAHRAQIATHSSNLVRAKIDRDMNWITLPRRNHLPLSVPTEFCGRACLRRGA